MMGTDTGGNVSGVGASAGAMMGTDTGGNVSGVGASGGAMTVNDSGAAVSRAAIVATPRKKAAMVSLNMIPFAERSVSA